MASRTQRQRYLSSRGLSQQQPRPGVGVEEHGCWQFDDLSLKLGL